MQHGLKLTGQARQQKRVLRIAGRRQWVERSRTKDGVQVGKVATKWGDAQGRDPIHAWLCIWMAAARSKSMDLVRRNASYLSP
ncbi:unnamed protein product, partial [Mycena citricolor]